MSARDAFLKRKGPHGLLTLVSYAEGWCMVRRPGAMPYVISATDWAKLPPMFGSAPVLTLTGSHEVSRCPCDSCVEYRKQVP